MPFGKRRRVAWQEFSNISANFDASVITEGEDEVHHFEISLNINQPTRRHIPKDSILQEQVLINTW